MSVHITEKAADEVKKLLEREKLPVTTAGLRVGVKGGGCSGLSYSMSLSEAPTEADMVFEDAGVRLFVDKKSYMHLAGTNLDFQDGLTGRGFVFENPNAQKSCGCGKSFGV